ncbi:purple acid phosphatase family protein [Paenibacillus sp. 2TAB23]|uniref:purple acid phosphatase family protein n=1 Tax=Paenibacillus sp. 2TAB23 TaxID=3233004 RepID=UPI003F99F75D
MKFRREVMVLLACCVLLLAGAVGMEWLRQSDAKKPIAVVTTFKGDPMTNRAFTWHSMKLNEEALVQVWEGTGEIDWKHEKVLTFTGNTTAVAIAENERQAVHKAEASGLEPGTVYTYRVGSGDARSWSEPAVFTTEAVDKDSFTFINVTDSQGVVEQDFTLWGNTLDKAFAMFPEASFIVHNGDLTEEPADEQAWTNLFNKAEEWVKSVPFMPVTGNHDEIEGHAERFVSHFDLPENGAAGSFPGTSYSFDYGPVHFVFLNTESNIKEQASWLRSDLAGTEKEWIIAALHQGPYGGNMNKKVKGWTELFDEFKVDLVLQGHNHEYSRSYPLRDGKVTGDGDSVVQNREGTVYVVTNTSGQKFNEKKEDKFYHKVHFQNEKQMFAGITISGNKLTYQAYDVYGRKWDEFVLAHSMSER